MKTGKEANLFEQTEKKQQGKTIFLFVLLVIISLFLGVLPTLSFGNPFQIAGDMNSSNQNAPAFGMDAPAPTFQASPQLSAPPAMSPQPAAINVPTSSVQSSMPPMPAPAAINPITAAPAGQEPILHPTTNPTLGGPSPIVQPHRSMIADTPPPPKPAPKTTRTPLPVQEKTVKPPVQTTTAHFVSSEPSYEQLKKTPNLLRSVADPRHPFAGYFEAPKAPLSQIKGQPLSIAQLLEGVGNPQARCLLLEKYWELTGLMVQYNVRMDSERFIKQTLDRGGADRNWMASAYSLVQQRCRAVELEFSKTQLQLAELLKQSKGTSFSDENLPIPCDYPIYKKYETYLDRIALTEKSRYLGRMIPIQEQLIGTQRAGCEAAAGMLQNSMQSNSRDLIFYLNQRTSTFCEMITAVVDYNKLIAEYTAETVGPGVSQYRLVGAVIELPNFTSTIQTPENKQPIQTATPIPNQFGSMNPVSDAPISANPSNNAFGRNSNPIDLASYVPETEQQATAQESPLNAPMFAPSPVNPSYAEGASELPTSQPPAPPRFSDENSSGNPEPPKLGQTGQGYAELKNDRDFAQHNPDFMPEAGMPRPRRNDLRDSAPPAPAGIDMPRKIETEAKEIQPVSYVESDN